MVLQYIESVKGHRKLLLDGHLYIKDKQIDSKIYWRCERYKKFKCSVRVISVDNDITKESGQHNHAADAAEVEAAQVMQNVRENARRTQDAPHFILSQASFGLSQATSAKLPKVDNMKRTIRNIRTKHDAAPAIPGNRRELVIPDNYKITKNGADFLLFDSGPTDDRILIFSTRRNLRLLAQSMHWYVDGTFKTVPHLFCQLYTIHGLQYNNAIPLVYALLPDKTEATYTRLLTGVKDIEPTVSPISILMDFELAMMNAVSAAFPQTRQRGCFFHFSQCFFRHVQSEGLQRRYEAEPEFALTMRLLPALAFVPAANVVDIFEQLCEDNVIPQEAQGVLDYFEDTWIGRPQRRHRRPPRFPHVMWNCFDGVNEDLPKTNNSVEGWHRGFDQQVSSNHPNIWKFIEALQREQSLNELKIEQYVSGEEPPRSQKRYRDCADRIKRLVSNFDIQGDIVGYLRGIAHNFNF